MLVFSALDLPFGIAVSQEIVAQEVVRGLVGGLGILAAVPVTTAIAAVVAARLVRERGRPHASTHAYSLEEHGLEAGEIRRRLAPLFDRFGWDEDEEVAADAGR